MSKVQKKCFVLDTNVLLHDPLAIYSFAEHQVIIPMTVLEELDQIKGRQKDIARDARVAIRALEDAMQGAAPEDIIKGVELVVRGDESDVGGRLAIFPDHQMKFDASHYLPDDCHDNRIINVAISLQNKQTDQVVTLVTKDINMRLKAKGASLQHVEDYRKDQLIEDVRYLAKGFIEFEGELWQQINCVTTEQHERHTFHHLIQSELGDEPLYLNQYLLDHSDDFAVRVERIDDNEVVVRDLGRDRLMGYHPWGIHPKNIYQGMALNALLDPEIELVILTGPAGSGKTLLALAAALEQVVEQHRYDKVIVTRNTPELAESIGFLPGTEEEKMTPWLSAVTDTLEVLHQHDESPNSSLNFIMEKANMQFKSVNFMRGRSIQNAFVLLDECQNLTASQIKTIITRMGEGTKLVCSGNLAQIDSTYLTAVTSGLTYIVERFKPFEGSANLYLDGVVRSRLASFAEENL